MAGALVGLKIATFAQCNSAAAQCVEHFFGKTEHRLISQGISRSRVCAGTYLSMSTLAISLDVGLVRIFQDHLTDSSPAYPVLSRLRIRAVSDPADREAPGGTLQEDPHCCVAEPWNHVNFLFASRPRCRVKHVNSYPLCTVHA